jgi:predicted amino acid racemase
MKTYRATKCSMYLIKIQSTHPQEGVYSVECDDIVEMTEELTRLKAKHTNDLIPKTLKVYRFELIKVAHLK